MKKVILALAIVSVSFVACNNSSDSKEGPKNDSSAIKKMDSAVKKVDTAVHKLDSMVKKTDSAVKM